jgi:histone H3/H4
MSATITAPPQDIVTDCADDRDAMTDGPTTATVPSTTTTEVTSSTKEKTSAATAQELSQPTDDVPAATAAATTELPSAIEFEPPLACIRRILKNALPASTNVGKDASAAFTRASGIFIIYLTACANDFARENKRQTITANDVLAAIKVCTRYSEFVPLCCSYFHSVGRHFDHLYSLSHCSTCFFGLTLFYRNWTLMSFNRK